MQLTIEINKEEFLSLIKERKSIQFIADHFNCSKHTVISRAKEFNVTFDTKRYNEEFPDGRRRLWHDYRGSAKRNKREFLLTKEQFFEIVQKPCTYCGREKTNVIERKSYNSIGINKKPFFYTGVDRIDSNKGYSLDNSTPCCETCNRAKRAMSVDLFIEWIKALANHYKCN